MIIKFTDDFDKQYKKSNVRIQHKFDSVLEIFNRDPTDLSLRNHSLKGKFLGKRSIDITGDWRAIYREEVIFDEKGTVKETIIYFIAIGTHPQLYR